MGVLVTSHAATSNPVIAAKDSRRRIFPPKKKNLLLKQEKADVLNKKSAHSCSGVELRYD
jgi:hypothetical protein